MKRSVLRLGRYFSVLLVLEQLLKGEIYLKSVRAVMVNFTDLLTYIILEESRTIVWFVAISVGWFCGR